MNPPAFFSLLSAQARMHSFIHAFTSPRIAGAAQFQRKVCSNCAALALCSQVWLVFLSIVFLAFPPTTTDVFFILFPAKCCSPCFSPPFADSTSLDLGKNRKIRFSKNRYMTFFSFFFFF